MPHYKRLVNPNYIGAYALNPGEDLTVQITKVQVEEITGTGGKTDNRIVAHLSKPNKPFILNATNMKTITRLVREKLLKEGASDIPELGADTDLWSGLNITLYASTTQVAGETVSCLRIRPVTARVEPKPISAERFTKAIESLRAGKVTAEKIRSGYALTPEQENELGNTAHQS